jgi:hypothetical protein
MPGMPGMPPGMDPANFDPSKYMQAMSGMFQNPQFMQMAEKLGQAIIQVRVVWQRGVAGVVCNIATLCICMLQVLGQAIILVRGVCGMCVMCGNAGLFKVCESTATWTLGMCMLCVWSGATAARLCRVRTDRLCMRRQQHLQQCLQFQQLLSDRQFMQMAEKRGQAIIKVRVWQCGVAGAVRDTATLCICMLQVLGQAIIQVRVCGNAGLLRLCVCVYSDVILTFGATCCGCVWQRWVDQT